MGNTVSDHQNSEGEEETYNYHQTVLKEGSTPVKGSAQVHLPETPESSSDEFVDAQEDKTDDEQEESYDPSFTGSEGSNSGSSQSGSKCSGSLDRSFGSNASHSSQSSNQSDRRSDQSMNGSEISSSSLPNRIRVIDTSESEGEEETGPVSSTNNPRKHLDFSNHGNRKGHHPNLPRPVPIHKSPSDSSQSQQSGDTSERSQQRKRKADDMEPEEETEVESEMAVPVKKNGGPYRPFARKRELRDIVLGRQTSSEETPGTSQSQASFEMAIEPECPENMVTSNRRVNGESHEKMEESEIETGKSKKEDSFTKFEHSNNSPFKNFHLQPSSSTAGADLSATAETPREKTKDAAPPQTLQTTHLGIKRPSGDPDPSTLRSAMKEVPGTSTQTQAFDMFDTSSVSGLNNGTRSEHTVSSRLIPGRGNTGDRSTGSPLCGKHPQEQEGRVYRQNTTYGQQHYTSELPRVNVAAAEKRYENASASRHSPAPSTSDWHKTALRHEGDRFSFLLADTLNVHICYDNITSLRTDALVNPTDGQLTHVNDTARKIVQATGPQMTNQCQFFLRQNGGPLETTEVVETYACGSLSGKVGHVVHVATPMFEAANEKSSVNKLLRSYLNCLDHINDNLGLVSVVFPCIGAGSYPQDTCINVFFESLLVHLAERKSSRIKTVKFVVSDVHLGNLAIAMVQAHLERAILEGIDVLMAEALNSYYGNNKWECNQNDLNDQLGRQLEVDSPKKLFRGPPVKRPRL